MVTEFSFWMAETKKMELPTRELVESVVRRPQGFCFVPSRLKRFSQLHRVDIRETNPIKTNLRTRDLRTVNSYYLVRSTII